MDDRARALEHNLAAVTGRIARAAAAPRAAGIEASQPSLIVVTKFHPGADVTRLASLGVTDVGENRDQEAAAKAVEVAIPALRWHFIGQLQTNKAKSVVRYAHSVHSVDRAPLVKALGKAMREQRSETGRAELRCFIQVDLGDYPETAGRGGAAPSEVLPLARMITATDGLVLDGVMAVAPLGEDPDQAFARLAGISAQLRGEFPQASAISAGMSQDLEAAIRWGATHLRVGSDVLGPRPVVL